MLDGVPSLRPLGTPHSPRDALARALGRTGRAQRKAPQAAVGGAAREQVVAGRKGGGGERRTWSGLGSGLGLGLGVGGERRTRSLEALRRRSRRPALPRPA